MFFLFFFFGVLIDLIHFRCLVCTVTAMFRGHTVLYSNLRLNAVVVSSFLLFIFVSFALYKPVEF